MKKLIMILILSLSFGICGVSAKEHHKDDDWKHRTEKRYERHHKDKKHKKNKKHDWKPGHGGYYRPTPPPPPRPRHYAPRHKRFDPALAYVIGTANVIFNGIVMQGVNIPSFVVLDYGYARDARHVYYYGKKLKGADPYTFQILPNGYARDAHHVYYYGKKL